MRKAYTTDLSEVEWALVEELLPPERRRGAKRTTDLCEVVDAILYMAAPARPSGRLPAGLAHRLCLLQPVTHLP